MKGPATAKKAGAMLLIALVVALLGFLAIRSFSKPASAANQAFFTTDDGATFFADSADKLAPFDHGGKQAYRATVYTADNGKTKKAAYLERFTPEGKSRMQERISQFRLGHLSGPPIAMPGDTEVKLPGAENAWVSTADINQAAKIRSANLSGDQNATYEILVP